MQPAIEEIPRPFPSNDELARVYQELRTAHKMGGYEWLGNFVTDKPHFKHLEGHHWANTFHGLICDMANQVESEDFYDLCICYVATIELPDFDCEDALEHQEALYDVIFMGLSRIYFEHRY